MMGPDCCWLTTAAMEENSESREPVAKSNERDSSVIKAYLSQPAFKGVKLLLWNWSEADLSGADLSWADMRGANLNRTDLRGAN